MTINGTQKNILDGTFKFYLAELDKLDDSIKFTVLKLANKENLSESEIVWLMKNDIWFEAIYQIQSIKKHPTPQGPNNVEGYATGGLNLSAYDKDEVQLDEHSNDNDSKIKDDRISKEDILNYIESHLSTRIKELEAKEVIPEKIKEVNQWLAHAVLTNHKYIELVELDKIQFNELFAIYTSDNAPKKIDALNKDRIFSIIKRNPDTFNIISNMLEAKNGFEKLEFITSDKVFYLIDKMEYKFAHIDKLLKLKGGKNKILALTQKEVGWLFTSKKVKPEDLYNIVKSKNGIDKINTIAVRKMYDIIVNGKFEDISLFVKVLNQDNGIEIMSKFIEGNFLDYFKNGYCNLEQFKILINHEKNGQIILSLSTKKAYHLIRDKKCIVDNYLDILQLENGSEILSAIVGDKIYDLLYRHYWPFGSILSICETEEGLNNVKTLVQAYDLIKHSKISCKDYCKLLFSENGEEKISLLSSYFITEIIKFEIKKSNSLFKTMSFVLTNFSHEIAPQLKQIIKLINGDDGINKIKSLNNQKTLFLVKNKHIKFKKILQLLNSEDWETKINNLELPNNEKEQSNIDDYGYEHRIEKILPEDTNSSEITPLLQNNNSNGEFEFEYEASLASIFSDI